MSKDVARTHRAQALDLSFNRCMNSEKRNKRKIHYIKVEYRRSAYDMVVKTDDECFSKLRLCSQGIICYVAISPHNSLFRTFYSLSTYAFYHPIHSFVLYGVI